MNFAGTRPASDWSLGRWLGTVAILAAGQAGLVVALTRWPSLPQPAATAPLHVQLAKESANSAAEVETLSSAPLLFAGEDAHGFSGAADRALPRGDYTVAELREAPQWLAAEGRRIGRSPAIILPEPRPLTAGHPRLAGDSQPSPLLQAGSRVSVGGGLAGRGLVTPLQPPAWKSSEVLGVTVVEVGVTAAGDVIAARVVSRPCGLPAADEAGRMLAAGAQFTPVNAEGRDPGLIAAELTWGELTFYWRTEPVD